MGLDQDIVQTKSPTRRTKLALVYMPFAMRDIPSIQLGLLSEVARNAGYHADCFYLNLDLAARLPETYENFCTFNIYRTGEWLFSVAAFGDAVDGDDAAYFKAFPSEVERVTNCGKTSDYLSKLRHEFLPRFIEDCLDLVPWFEYDLVGFSSTFQQSVSSLALARRIKRRWPQIRIVFGGENMAGEMGPAYARAFPFIDYVMVGEADRALPDLLKALEKGNESPDLPGLVSRIGGELNVRGMALPIQELDQLPTPNYDDYFDRYHKLRFPPFKKSIPLESSRGCWWGEKQQCTFCGHNASRIGFRKKSVPRVLDELALLSEKYGITYFQTTDCIMDMDYINSLFRQIEERRYDYQFFYEVKANLRRDQIRQLRAGGMRWIQSGIESMNSRVLKLMRKGSTMLHNVRLLKWSLYYRIRVGWNLLWGFPGETADDSAEEYRVLKLLLHLEPPVAASRIRMDRFSPIFEDRETFPVKWLRPEKSYQFAYPNHVELDKIAYYFDYEFEETTSPDARHDTNKLLDEWRSRFHDRRRRPSLVFRRTQNHLLIDDSRFPELSGTHSYSGAFATAYEFCSDTMRSAYQVATHVNRTIQDKSVLSASDAEDVLADFCTRGLMLSENGQYLSLALPTFQPPPA
ncbi:MAG: RiPP maturation radical SAM protein 1 [bacterium]|nr:RiPP maturation radical SAM protein 1 [bacterium]